jgi:hypothetical protein
LTDAEFTIGPHTYRAARLNARQQFDVARRLTNVLAMLGAEKSPEFKPTPDNFARAILFSAGSIPQADMDMALGTCLGVVKRRMPGDQGWAPIATSSGSLMYDDMGMPEMLEALWHVLSAHRLPDFLYAGVRASSEAKTQN